MLENIANNSMYTTIPPFNEPELDEFDLWEMSEIPEEPYDDYFDFKFIEQEKEELEDILKNCPEEMR